MSNSCGRGSVGDKTVTQECVELPNEHKSDLVGLGQAQFGGATEGV